MLEDLLVRGFGGAHDVLMAKAFLIVSFFDPSIACGYGSGLITC